MPDRPENKRREHLPIEQVAATDDKNEETEELDHRGTRAFNEAPSIIRDAPPASPLRFYARLRHQLESRGISYDDLPRFTPEGESPPCFRGFRVSFDAFLSAASTLGSTVPYRLGMPAEPNYCIDCTAKFQTLAKSRGLCQFPDVRFEHSRTRVPGENGKTEVEVEILGMTRPTRLDRNPAGAYDPEDLPESASSEGD